MGDTHVPVPGGPSERPWAAGGVYSAGRKVAGGLRGALGCPQASMGFGGGKGKASDAERAEGWVRIGQERSRVKIGVGQVGGGVRLKVGVWVRFCATVRVRVGTDAEVKIGGRMCCGFEPRRLHFEDIEINCQ